MSFVGNFSFFLLKLDVGPDGDDDDDGEGDDDDGEVDDDVEQIQERICQLGRPQ